MYLKIFWVFFTTFATLSLFITETLLSVIHCMCDKQASTLTFCPNSKTIRTYFVSRVLLTYRRPRYDRSEDLEL
ncbi:MAG: hypothetical protein J07HX5_00876 [halophilic archaeon J07HX5]|nr:MAG: hypothetical protein J07HX5_00876 [halophilic archaeon J07HX5]